MAKGPRIPTLGAGGLFITLAPLQTDVSLYFELALNRSLISSLSHGLKPEGECEGTGGESAGLAVLPRLPVPVPRRAHGGLGARSMVMEVGWKPLDGEGRTMTPDKKGLRGVGARVQALLEAPDPTGAESRRQVTPCSPHTAWQHGAGFWLPDSCCQSCPGQGRLLGSPLHSSHPWSHHRVSLLQVPPELVASGWHFNP